jgi:hypothetical protein
MRHNPSTVVVLVGPADGEVLSAIGGSMNVTLIRAEDPAASGGAGGSGDDGIAAAGAALRQAGRSTSPYAVVPADPLAVLAGSWRAMWDVSRPDGAAEFEQAALLVLAAWRAGQFELPDYYLMLAAPADDGHPADHGPDFYLGPLRSVRPHRVSVVAAAEPAKQAGGALQTLGSLRHGPWWPGLDDVIETARGFYPDSLAEGNAALTRGTQLRPLIPGRGQRASSLLGSTGMTIASLAGLIRQYVRFRAVKSSSFTSLQYDRPARAGGRGLDVTASCGAGAAGCSPYVRLRAYQVL